jgi:hypothetical protein
MALRRAHLAAALAAARAVSLSEVGERSLREGVPAWI